MSTTHIHLAAILLLMTSVTFGFDSNVSVTSTDDGVRVDALPPEYVWSPWQLPPRPFLVPELSTAWLAEEPQPANSPEAGLPTADFDSALSRPASVISGEGDLPGGTTPGELKQPTASYPLGDVLNSPAKPSVTGFLDFNYYWDTREFNTLTINTGANLPYDVQYFQLTNFSSALDSPDTLRDWRGFFTEIHFRRAISKENPLLKPFDWSLMFADGSTAPDVQRLGVRFRLQDSPGLLGHLMKDVLKLQYSVTLQCLGK